MSPQVSRNGCQGPRVRELCSAQHSIMEDIGVLLKFDGVVSGQVVSAEWKAASLAPKGEEKFKWELRRTFPTLGYDMSKNSNQPVYLVRQIKETWLAKFEAMNAVTLT